MHQRLNFLLPLAALFLLSSCGGGGSTASSSAGATSVVAFTGPIAGIGSIVVNGVRFETVGISVKDSDDMYGSSLFKSPLSLGMTVALAGDVDETALTGTSREIRVIGGVRGILSAITSTTITTASGQSVTVDVNTVYAGIRSTLAALQVSDAVEIFGVNQSNGDFLATRVVSSLSISATNKLVIRGTIQSISSNNYVVKTSSSPNDIVTVACDTPCLILPSGATLTAASSSVAGTPVRVVALDTTSLTGGVLTAVKIQSLSPEKLTEFNGFSVTYAKIKGYTTQIASDWYVGGVKVTGLPLASTSVGQFLEVKGVWVGNVLQATKVETENDRTVDSHRYKNEFYGKVSGLLGSTFIVQGVTVNASSAIFSGGTLSTLANDNYV